MSDELDPQVGRNALDDLETVAKNADRDILIPLDVDTIENCIRQLRPFVEAVEEG